MDSQLIDRTIKMLEDLLKEGGCNYEAIEIRLKELNELKERNEQINLQENPGASG